MSVPFYRWPGAGNLLKTVTTVKRRSFTCTSGIMSQSNVNGIKGNSDGMKRFVNDENVDRKPSLIRELTALNKRSPPDVIFMAGGMPNDKLFPFSSISVKLNDEEGTTLEFEGDELRQSLQYQATTGYIPFNNELRKFVEHWFKPQQSMDDLSVIVTVGSQNALSAVLNTTLSRGDPVIVPDPCYAAVMNIMEPYKPTYVLATEDAKGMKPDSLRSALKRWYESANATPGKELFNDRNFKRPKILYVNPTGGNPSGTVIPLERKKEIYRIAQEYDLLILEDDPYYFIHFFQENPTSFLSLDVEGRVIRLDSFSKVLSSGLRVGFATGPKDFIRSVELYLQASILHASSLSQVLATGVLQKWGVDGFTKHADRVKAFYKRRRDMMISFMEKYLTGLAEWNVPDGGMFIWMKVKGVEDTREMILNRGLQNKILALPGNVFMVDQPKPCPYVRLAYSIIPEEQIEEGIRRLATLIKEELKLK